MQKITAKNILGKRISVVVAHPDDESFAAAGTIDANHKARGKTAVICVTCGEKGKAHLAKPCTVSELKAIRKKELRNVARFLRVDSLKILNIPDGKVRENKNKVYKKIFPLIKKFKPDIVLSFGPDGITGHLDHIAVGEIARKIADSLGAQFVSFAAPPQLIKNIDHLKKRRKFGVYAKNFHHKKHDFRIAVNPNIKLQTMRFHKSQFNEDGESGQKMKKLMRKLAGFEYFAA